MFKFMLMACCAVFCLLTAALAEVGEQPVVAAIGDDGVQRIEVVGGGYYFRPSHIVVKVNVPVELKVRKEGGIVPHDIVIDAPDAEISVSESLSTEPKIVRFTPVKVGKYSLYCSKKPPFFKSHREKGMEGVLEVIE
jgi:plastocyanin domain-containing protein